MTWKEFTPIFLTHRDLLHRIDYKDIVRTRKQKGERFKRAATASGGSLVSTCCPEAGEVLHCVAAAAGAAHHCLASQPLPGVSTPKSPAVCHLVAAFSASEMLTGNRSMGFSLPLFFSLPSGSWQGLRDRVICLLLNQDPFRASARMELTTKDSHGVQNHATSSECSFCQV